MDEKSIDSRLKERFEVYEDSTFDTKNWERLSRTLLDRDLSSKKLVIGSKSILLPGIVFLLLSNVILSGFLLKSHQNIQLLLQNQEILKTEKTIQRDTVYISKSTLSSSEYTTSNPKQNNPPFESYQLNIKLRNSRVTEGRQTSLKTYLATQSGKIEEDPTRQESLKRKPPSLASEAQKDISENTGLSIQVVPSPRLLSKESQNDEVFLKKKKPAQLSQLKKKLTIWKHKFKPGFFIALPRIKTDKSQRIPGFNVGLDLEVQLNGRFYLRTAISYLPLSYKIDDNNQQEEINDLMNTYPVISEDQSISSLHEVYTSSHVLDIPLGIRYNFNKSHSHGLFVEGGVYSKMFLRQNFEYEFSKEGSRYIQDIQAGRKGLAFGGVYTSLGSKFDLFGRTRGEIEVFMQKDLQPQGTEGRLYSIWGLKGTIRLRP